MQVFNMKTQIPKGQSPDYHFNAYYSGKHLSHLFHKKKIDKVVSFIEPEKSVLDAGCGSSALAFILSKKGCTVSGVDVKKHYIDFVSKKCKGSFYCADLRSMRLKKKFDVVTCLDVIEHFTPQDRIKVLKTLDAHLKPGGKLILSFPSALYLHYVEGPWHFVRDRIYGTHDYDDFGTHETVSSDIVETFFTKLGYEVLEKSSLGYGLDRFLMLRKAS